MTALEPTFTVDPVPPERFSMSFLRAAGACLRRAHYERIEDNTGVDAVIGRIFHEIADKVGWATVMRGQKTPDYAEVERIARHVLSQPDEFDPMPKHAWDEVLDIVGRWMLKAEFHPEEQFEISLRHRVRGRLISMRIDRLLIIGTTAYVKDYKSGRADPPQRPEPTPQGDVYAWGVVREHPHVTEVVFEQHHVRFGHEPQPFTYTLDAIAEIDAWLHDTVGRIEATYAAGGDLPTNPGSACSLYDGCPVAADCPVKKWARPATIVRSHEEALAELVALLAEDASVSDRKKQIRAWVERESLRALITSDDEALEQFMAMFAEDASVAQRKAMIRGWVARSGVRAIQHGGQEIGYAVDVPSPGTDWQAMALASGKDPAEFVKKQPKNPAFGVRKAK